MVSAQGAADPVTYAGAGVDVEAGDRAVDLMRAAVVRTHAGSLTPPFGGFGAFAGLVDASALLSYRRPLLATSTDGVGTKIVVAQAMDRHDTIGADLVAMVVDDIVVCGAQPLFMTDYIACGRLVPERIAAIVAGIAQACQTAGCALVGGETAEHPGVMKPEEYDLAGAAVGVVEADDLLGPQRVVAGDVLIAMASSGLHSNGYSLVREVLTRSGTALTDHVAELGRTVGEELLEPTRIYAKDVLALAAELGADLHAVSHVTGGGLAANLARVLPPGLLGTVERPTWTPAPVFDLVISLGKVPAEEAERTLNLGVGMVAVVAADAADGAVRLLTERGLPAWAIGSVSTLREEQVGAPGVVQGAKGVTGGAAQLVGAFQR